MLVHYNIKRRCCRKWSCMDNRQSASGKSTAFYSPTNGSCYQQRKHSSNYADAYDVIADADDGYAAFVVGPSKTANIEQSLVLKSALNINQSESTDLRRVCHLAVAYR